jgi:hypothetical protein
MLIMETDLETVYLVVPKERFDLLSKKDQAEVVRIVMLCRTTLGEEEFMKKETRYFIRDYNLSRILEPGLPFFMGGIPEEAEVARKRGLHSDDEPVTYNGKDIAQWTPGDFEGYGNLHGVEG